MDVLGRKQQAWTVNCSASARNLCKRDLGGVIFGCKHSTIRECFSKKLFGLPASHFSYVKKIDPGLPLFLFNYSDRQLHGIFEAASPGQLNIDLYGWTEEGSDYTPYAAQVKIQIRMQCQPLRENVFSPIISNNYYAPTHFWFELDRAQANKLISLFSSSPVMSSTFLSRNIEKWCALLKPSLAPKAMQDGEKIAVSNPGVEVVHQTNQEWGSSWHDPSLGGENKRFKAVIGNGEDEGAVMSQSLGRSYSSVVKTMNSVLHSNKSNMEWGSWDNSAWGGENQLLEATIDSEAAEYHKQGVVHKDQCADRSYSSVVKSTGTSIPEKKWSSLFNDSKKEVEDFRRPTLEMNPFLVDRSNGEWKQSYAASYLNGNSHPLEAPAVKEDLQNHNSVFEIEVPCSSAVIQTSPYETAHIAEGRRGAEDFSTSVAEDNHSYVEDHNLKWISSLVSPFLDGDSPPLESPREEYSKGLHEEERVNFISNSECSSFSVNTREMVSDDNRGEHSEIHLRDQSFPGAVTCSDMNSSAIQSLITKLLFEVEELKSSQSTQFRKINSLEQELVESRKEIQVLKDCCRLLGPLPVIGHVEAEESEAEEFESLNEYHPDLEESILIVGGFDGSSWLSALDSYNPREDLLKSLRPMSSIRSYASIAKLNGELYVFGGLESLDDNLWHNTVESYNPLSNQWVSRPSLNQRKGSLAGVSSNDKIFAIGGGNGVECFSEVEMLDLDIGRWIPSRSMLHKRFAPAAAEINGTLYVVGGFDEKDYLKSIERFDPREHAWTRLQSMTTKRGCHSLAVLNEKLYAVGGYDGASMVPTVETFDPRIGSWMMGESMNESRGYSGAVVLGDQIYVIGGLKDDQQILGTVECYKEGHGWEVTDLKALGQRCFFSAIAF